MTQQLDAEISSSLQISPVSRPIASRLKNTLHDTLVLPKKIPISAKRVAIE